MIGDIRRHLELTRFVPFSVATADGHEYPVPTMDHIWLPPGGRRVAISDDRGIVVGTTQEDAVEEVAVDVVVGHR